MWPWSLTLLPVRLVPASEHPQLSTCIRICVRSWRLLPEPSSVRAAFSMQVLTTYRALADGVNGAGPYRYFLKLFCDGRDRDDMPDFTPSFELVPA